MELLLTNQRKSKISLENKLKLLRTNIKENLKLI